MPTALRTLLLRSSRAHSDRKPAVEVQQCPLRAEVDMEVDAEVVEEKLEDEEEKKKKEEEDEEEENNCDKI